MQCWKEGEISKEHDHLCGAVEQIGHIMGKVNGNDLGEDDIAGNLGKTDQ